MIVELINIDLRNHAIICLTTKGNILYNIDGNKVLVLKRMFNRACKNGMIIPDAFIKPLPPQENKPTGETIYVVMTLSPF